MLSNEPKHKENNWYCKFLCGNCDAKLQFACDDLNRILHYLNWVNLPRCPKCGGKLTIISAQKLDGWGNKIDKGE